MCGITGFFDKSQLPDAQSVLGKMLATIQQRGPDSEGMWHDDGMYLGHRRLSILDLSVAGHQPMISQSRRYAIVFNGEIYNHKEIKQKLSEQINHHWTGHSDTEVMLAAVETWGIDTALKSFNGMFAFAVWDSHQRKLILARDRLGEKPLYYTKQDNTFIFGSELNCLEAHPFFKRDIDQNALGEYFKFKAVPAPLTIYQNTYKLLPGHYLIWSSKDQSITQHCYWDLAKIARQGQENLASYDSEEEVIEKLDQLIRDAVGLRMEADVPLGAFLSGGIDSSIVVAQMQAQSIKPVKTFSIGFDIPGYNEAKHAKEVANYLGTDHTEQYVTGRQAMKVVPKLGGMYDEPFADSSQIPTYLVSGMAKKHVTVCLSGDGGDELFGGYSRYQAAPEIWNKVNKIPMRRLAAKTLDVMPEISLEVLVKIVNKIAKPYMHNSLTSAKLKQIVPWLSVKNQYALYRLSLQTWKRPEILLQNYHSDLVTSYNANFDLSDFLHIMMLHDSLNYLPNDILNKVDRATMAVSLEGRVPLLDHRIAEFAWHLPANMKYRENEGKWILKQVLYRYVSRELIDRPKMGFGVPLGSWLKQDLREWAENLLNPIQIREQGLLNPEIINQYWEAHQAGKGDYSSQLWPILMFQAWKNER